MFIAPAKATQKHQLKRCKKQEPLNDESYQQGHGSRAYYLLHMPMHPIRYDVVAPQEGRKLNA